MPSLPGHSPPLLWTLLLAALAAAGFVGTFRFLRRSRLLEDMPTSRVRSAAQGYVELEGTAQLMDGPPIVSPLTATRCCWFRYSVEEKRRQEDASGKGGWVTVTKGASDDCFLLDDGEGRCIVDPDGASVIPGLQRRWYGYSATPDISPEMGQGWWRAMWCTYRYTEEFLLMSKPLYALGSYRTQTGIAEPVDEDADLRDLLDKWKHDPRMMALFDTNKDGTVDQHEWEAARRAALAQVRREQVQRSVDTPDLNILARPRDGRPFILSGVTQRALVARYRLYAAASLAAAGACAGLLLWILRTQGAPG